MSHRGVLLLILFVMIANPLSTAIISALNAQHGLPLSAPDHSQQTTLSITSILAHHVPNRSIGWNCCHGSTALCVALISTYVAASYASSKQKPTREKPLVLGRYLSPLTKPPRIDNA